MAVSVNGGALQFDAVINNTQFKRQLDEMESKLRSLTTVAEREAKAVDSLARNASTAIAGYLSFATASNFVQDVVRIRGEFQQLEVAFRTMLKSKVQADILLKQAVDLAAKTPFTLQDVGSGAKQLLAYGFAANQVTETIEMIGNVAAGVGAPLNDIIYLYGTLRTQGQVFNKDILQFTNRGIPIVAELAKVMKTSEQEIKGMVEAGKIGFPQVEQAFRNLTGESGKFYNLMREQSKTLTGQVSNLQDAWSRMMNEIGKSNEGILSNALGTAIKIVESYQEVIKIVKTLVLTYGTYRAGLILTNALTLTTAELTAGVTVAQKLHYAALVASDKAMKVLHATMLSNPYVALASALGLFVSALLFYRKETAASFTATELLKQAAAKSNGIYEEQKVKVQALVAQIKAGNLTEEKRLSLYNELNKISPNLVSGLTAQSLSYQKLKLNVDDYLNSIRARIKLEANSAAITASVERENAIQAEIEQQQRLVDSLKTVEKGYKNVAGGSSFGVSSTGSTGAAQRLSEAQAKLNDLQKEFAAQQAETAKLGKQSNEQLAGSVEQLSDLQRDTVATLDEKIKKYREEQAQVSKTSKTYKEFEKAIKELERQRREITGETIKQTPAENAVDNAREKLKTLVEDVAQAERSILQSGLTKEQQEVARIEQKYDELRERARELKASPGIFARIDRAESSELGQQKTEQRLEAYKQYIGQQQEVFKTYEDLKLKYGTDRANQLTDNQVAAYGGYIDFLQKQLALLKFDNSDAGVRKRTFLAAALSEAEKQQIKKDSDFRISEFDRVEQATITFNLKRKQIEDKFQRDLAVARKEFTGDEYKEREAALTESRDQELADLNSAAIRSSGIYRKLNEDILAFTRRQLIQRKKELEKYLATAVGIPPQVRKDIEDYVKRLDGIIKETSDGVIDPKKMREVSQVLGEASGWFAQMAQAVGDVNAGLADTLQVLSEITGVASNVTLALANFAGGNILGGITASISAVIGVFKIFSEARKSQRKAQQEMEQFQTKMIASEIDINVLYQERERQQVKINKLRLQGIQAESQLLKQQATQNQQDYNRIFALIQKERYITGQKEEKYGGVLGIGRKTRVVNTYGTLQGKTYEELEKLFLSGQLEGKALELFKTLEKLKQAGVDIDAALQQNAEAAKQIFTGTTFDSIADQIADGFANGLRSAADFAKNFEDLMKGAIINALKYQTLEGPLKEFYEAFAASAESDGILTEEEIKLLKENFNAIISNAGARFEELKKITNVDFSSTGAAGAQQRGLAGAIKGITEEQAELLAGQFGGLRLTAADHLRVAQGQLLSLQKIELYTGNLVQMRAIWERIELSGIKVK